MVGGRTIPQLLARRAVESISFSVPDRNALWSRTEDDLLVQDVAKHSTSDVLGRDWIEVTSDLSGRRNLNSFVSYELHTWLIVKAL